MIETSAIEELSEHSAPDRCFLSIYLDGEDREWLERQLSQMPALADGTDLEVENLERTVEMVRDWFDEHAVESRALALFASWAADYVRAVELDVPVERRLVVDSSPFVLPLAEIADEFENWCIVLADNDAARIFEVGGLEITEADRVAGEIKNSVKVGGWSQQRYERRRQKQISEYCSRLLSVLVLIAPGPYVGGRGSA